MYAILFWFFLLNGIYLDTLYVKIAVGFTSHVGVILSTVWYYLNLKGKLFIEQWDILFNKNKTKNNK
jgi:hypothetical protein